MPDPKKDNIDRLFRFLPLILGISGLGMFFMTIFAEKEPPIQSLYWFLLVIGALLLPYIKEVTLGDIRVTLQEGLEKQQEELAETRKDLEEQLRGMGQAMAKVQAVDEEFGEIRDELIRGYQIYLMKVLQTDEERFDKVVMLNKMYMNEMQLTIPTLKEYLGAGGFFSGKKDDQYTMEMLNGIKAFQRSQGMVPDGIFGHNSLRKLRESLAENVRDDSK